jgi:nucleoside-diphosphate-sugar epimerase/predicted dehydrogenase
MTAAPDLRAAIIGCGRVSAFHVAALKAVRGVEIAAVCDLDERLARERAKEAGIERSFTDAETMLRDVEPHVVHILTPPASHESLARLSASQRAHVYVEKPLAPNAVEAAAIVDAARAAGVKVCVGHSRLFDPVFREACRLIDAGEIGHIVSIRAEQGFSYEAAARSAVIPWSYTYEWGIFDNLMPHPLSVACHFLGEPDELQATGFSPGCVREAAVEEVRVQIRSGRRVAEVSLSLCASPEVNRLEVVGTAGRILVDFNAMTVLSRGRSSLPAAAARFTSSLEAAGRLTASTFGVALGIASGRIKRYMGLRAHVAAFYGALAAGEDVPVSGEDGLRVVRMMDEIKRQCGPAAKPRVAPAAEQSAPPRVLVTGATGFLGGRLIERLSADGIPVRATTRLMSRARPMSGVEWVECDLSDGHSLQRALSGIDTVFHCAAMAGAPGSLRDYEEANVNGTTRLASLAADAGIQTLVYLSSLSVYGLPSSRNGYLDESTPYDDRAADRGVYTQSKLAAERALLVAAETKDAMRIVVLRAGTIYGPGAKLPTGRLELGRVKGRPLVAGGEDVPVPLTHVDNLIDAMRAAAEAPVPSPRIYNVVDSPETDQGEISRILRHITAGRIRPIFLPRAMVWALMLGVDVLALARRGKLGTARFRLKRTLADMRFHCAAARSELGWHPRITLDEGLAQVVEASSNGGGNP